MKKICFELVNGKKFFVDVYEEAAPITAANFLHLVDIGFYENTLFHRAIPGFMIQGGGYVVDESTLVEKPTGYTIPGEFANNNFINEIKHEPGIISMARTNEMNSASSQFFICDGDCGFLDGNYAAFGKISDEESFNIVHELCAIPTSVLGQGFENFPEGDSDEFTIRTAYRVIDEVIPEQAEVVGE